MEKIYNKTKSLRNLFGLSQSKLSQESSLSLATIQKIEAEKANPSIETLEALFQCFGFELQLRPEAPDWPALASCGLPISCRKTNSIKPSQQRLVLEMRRMVHASLGDREYEAVSALLWALQDHYPTLYAAEFSSAAFEKFKKAPRVGRLIKLRRNAVAILSRFL